MRNSLLAAAVIAIVFAGLSPVAALAKFPPFSVEVEPESPRAGQPVRIIVRTWEDAAHTQVADWGIPSPLEDLLTLYRAVDADTAAYTGVGGLDVSPEETDVGEWTAELPALEVGSWILRPFPGRPSDEPPPTGYPGDVWIIVTSPSANAGTYLSIGKSAAAPLIA
jgi:hypothetical protein